MKKILDQPQGLRRQSALRNTGTQLAFGDDAHGNIFPVLGEQEFQNDRVLLECIDAGIGVENEFHRIEDRFSTSPCAGSAKSSGTPANDSNHPSGHWEAGSKITACPSRLTSTVSVSKRNSFGRLTAWLLPVQNTLA